MQLGIYGSQGVLSVKGLYVKYHTELQRYARGESGLPENNAESIWRQSVFTFQKLQPAYRVQSIRQGVTDIP